MLSQYRESTVQAEEDDLEAIEGRNIELDFGRLEIFKERTQYVTFLRPMTDEDIIYTIKRNYSVKSIKPNFILGHDHGVLKPNNDFRLAVTYKPTIPSLRDIEVYDYKDNDNENIKITLSGVAVGPHCTLSTKRLDFYKTPDKKMLERKVELNNDSEATARFKVDIADHDVFHVDPVEGCVKPNKYLYITVKFCPRMPGVFARKIFFLIWNSEPLVLNALGLWRVNVGVVDLGLRYFTNEHLFGFRAYLDDVLICRKDVPPFSITTNYLDFGCVLKDGHQPRRQVISVTNHRSNPIIVDWNRTRNPKPSVFKIIPDWLKILPSQSEQCQIEFNPDDNYNVYHETMMAQVDWNWSEDRDFSSNYTVPITCFLRVQGHSFPNNEGWIAQVAFNPEVVYWQPCAPGDTASTSFLMRNRSHLPALYKLVPPKKSNVIAKPMMGKFRDREIIIIQLQTEPIKIKTYIEEWKIIINGREDRPITVYFHGESCVPTVEIGKKNKINAGSVQHGSQKDVEVMMKNTSYYAIRYQFRLTARTNLHITPNHGTLPLNGSTKLVIKVTGNQCAPKNETFFCDMHIIDGNGAIAGDSYEAEIEISTEVSYSQLCACPDGKDFGRITFGHRIKCEFEAVNFGDTSIFFQTCQSGDEPLDTNFRIKPCFGEIKPKDCRTFSVTGIVSEIGNSTLHFGYYNRMVKDSPLVTGDPITLFKLSYFSEFPIIQIGEIVEHNFGKLFSKSSFYLEYFDIPTVNTILREVRNDETVEVQLRVPDFPLDANKEYFIKLALTNISDFDTTVSLNRNKICDCVLEETTVGLSERKKGFNCPHRETLSMELENGNFLAKGTRFLTVKVKYTIPNTTVMSYYLQMTNNRSIEIFINIYVIPKETPTLSKFTEEFKWSLKDIYIGLRIAPIQMFWFYNNTGTLLTYEVDMEEVTRLCTMEGFNVMEILNPKDQVLPYQSKALLVKFHPIEIKTYMVEVALKYHFPGEPHKETVVMSIQGNGVMDLEPLTKKLDDMPRSSKFIGNFPVTLSLEYIEIRRLPVWSRRKELIFIKNNSRGKIIQYVWGTVKIQDLIEISTEVTYNILQPKEMQPVVITIKSFSSPCSGTFILPCEVLEYSDYVIHKITKEKHELAENRITEFMQGEPIWAKKPKNPITVLRKPETLYASVTICLTTLHTKDFDENIDQSIRIKQYPNQSVENIPRRLLRSYYPQDVGSFPQKEKQPIVVSVSDRAAICQVMEGVVSEVIFSKTLKTLLEKSSKAPMHYYNEFVMDDKLIMERKRLQTPLSNEDIAFFRQREIECFFNQPRPTDLSNILQSLIYDSMLNMVQCHKPEYNLKELNEAIEKSLYNCKNKSCPCNKKED